MDKPDDIVRQDRIGEANDRPYQGNKEPEYFQPPETLPFAGVNGRRVREDDEGWSKYDRPAYIRRYRGRR